MWCKRQLIVLHLSSGRPYQKDCERRQFLSIETEIMGYLSLSVIAAEPLAKAAKIVIFLFHAHGQMRSKSWKMGSEDREGSFDSVNRFEAH